MSNKINIKDIENVTNVDEAPVQEEQAMKEPVSNPAPEIKKTWLHVRAEKYAAKCELKEKEKAEKKKAAKAAKGGLSKKEKIGLAIGGVVVVGGMIFKEIVKSAKNQQDDYELVDDQDEGKQETPCFPVEENETETADVPVEDAQVES